MGLKFILFLVAMITTLVLSVWFFAALLRKGNLRATRFFASAVTGNQGPSRPLALSFYVYIVFLVIALGMLLFLALMCAFYTIALIHGEILLLQGALSQTAGNLAAHLFYPLEVFLLGLCVTVLFVGTFQIFLGPIEPLSRMALRVDGIESMCRKMIALVLVVLVLELCKTATYTLLAQPENLSMFFAGSRTPLLSTGSFAVVTASSCLAGGIALVALKQKR